MLSPIPATSLTNLRQLALKMEKILLAALDGYGNTFVEPKVELGARFGHLICALIAFCFNDVLDKSFYSALS
jgi:regulatory factor X